MRVFIAQVWSHFKLNTAWSWLPGWYGMKQRFPLNERWKRQKGQKGIERGKTARCKGFVFFGNWLILVGNNVA